MESRTIDYQSSQSHVKPALSQVTNRTRDQHPSYTFPNHANSFPSLSPADWSLDAFDLATMYTTNYTTLANVGESTLLVQTTGNWTLMAAGVTNETSAASSNETTVTLLESGTNNYWALMAIVLVFGTAAGNILVCLAICWERRLQNVTNYFLMSLAITDLMVAILVMPLGIVTLVKGLINYFFSHHILCNHISFSLYIHNIH